METNNYSQIDGAIEALNSQIRLLKQLKATLESKDRQIEELSQQLMCQERETAQIIANSTLDRKYSKTLVCFQRIDDMFRNLEANIASPNFQRNVYMALNEALLSYGYRFMDYTEQTKHFYEVEHQPIEAAEVIFRAIGRIENPQTGEIVPAVKGKVFLPDETSEI